ncbi:MAG: helix-turn-helix transcriptional regulator [Chloroflexota bacterium]
MSRARRAPLSHVFPGASPGNASFAHRAELLTERQKQVLGLLAQGKTNRQIAQALQISVRTVEFHAGNVLTRLGVTCRLDAARCAWTSAKVNDRR